VNSERVKYPVIRLMIRAMIPLILRNLTGIAGKRIPATRGKITSNCSKTQTDGFDTIEKNSFM